MKSRKEEEAHRTKAERMKIVVLPDYVLCRTPPHKTASVSKLGHPAPLAPQHRQIVWGQNYFSLARCAVVPIAVYCIVCHCLLSCNRSFFVMSNISLHLFSFMLAVLYWMQKWLKMLCSCLFEGTLLFQCKYFLGWCSLYYGRLAEFSPMKFGSWTNRCFFSWH